MDILIECASRFEAKRPQSRQLDMVAFCVDFTACVPDERHTTVNDKTDILPGNLSFTHSSAGSNSKSDPRR